LDEAVKLSIALEQALNERYNSYSKRVAAIFDTLRIARRNIIKPEVKIASDRTRTITASMATLQHFFSDRTHQCIRPLAALDPDLITSIMDADPAAKRLKRYLELLLAKEQQTGDYRTLSRYPIIIGPHGVAKSVLAEAVALQTNFDEVVFVKGAIIGNEYQKTPQLCIEDLFKPVINDSSKQWLIIIDEIDAIDGDQQEGRQKAARGAASVALNLQLDSCATKKNIAVLATTWRPERLEADLRSRFRDEFQLKSLDDEFLTKVLLQYLLGKPNTVLDQSVTMDKIIPIISQLPNMNIRDIQGITDIACLNGCMRSTDKTKPVVITMEDLKEAIKNKKSAMEFRGIPKKDDPAEQQKRQIEIAEANHKLTRNQAIVTTALGTASLAATTFFGYEQWQLGKESFTYTQFASIFATAVTAYKWLTKNNVIEEIKSSGIVQEALKEALVLLLTGSLPMPPPSPRL